MGGGLSTEQIQREPRAVIVNTTMNRHWLVSSECAVLQPTII
jgi:hypothetical protein